MTFHDAIRFTLQWEGRYVNDSLDPGGETYCGISRRHWPNWPGWQEIDSAKEGGLDPERLDSPAIFAMVEDFYRDNFWRPAGCDDMEWPLSLVAFDTAVNIGVARAKKYADEVKADYMMLIMRRIKHYADLVGREHRLQKFLRGWINRCYALASKANRTKQD